MEQEGFVFRYQFATEDEREAYEQAYSESYSECQKQLYTEGYQIYTSFDLQLQEELQAAVDDTLSGFTEKNDEGVYDLQGAAVCIDNDNGYVRAMVGGREQDFDGYTLNRAYQSYRQPGSAIKPLTVYTPLFERNYTPESIVVDEPVEDGPKNANGTYLGNVTVRTAVEKSINTIAWKLYEELTPQVGLSYLENMHFSRLMRRIMYRRQRWAVLPTVCRLWRWQPDMRRSPMTECTASRPVLCGLRMTLERKCISLHRRDRKSTGRMRHG